jgi:hypothetical protein
MTVDVLHAQLERGHWSAGKRRFQPVWKSATDVLAFVQLPQGVKPVQLLLPASSHGSKGTWKISLEGK